MGVCGPTTNHEEIHRWAESQGASPAQTSASLHDGQPPHMRFKFAGRQNRKDLEDISWELFFAQFDAMGLAFVYETEDADGPTGLYQLLHTEEASAFRFGSKPV